MKIANTPHHGFPIAKISSTYFLRFTRSVVSFASKWFLWKLAPTLHACIYWVQADFTPYAGWMDANNSLS